MNLVWWWMLFITYIFEEDAIINGIELIGFDNAKDGIEELKRIFLAIWCYRFVDGKFYKIAGKTGDAIVQLFLMSLGLMIKLVQRRVLPWSPFYQAIEQVLQKEKNRYTVDLK